MYLCMNMYVTFAITVYVYVIADKSEIMPGYVVYVGAVGFCHICFLRSYRVQCIVYIKYERVET